MRRLLTLLLLGCVLDARAAEPVDDPALPAIVWTYEYVLATAQTEREITTITDRILKDRWLPKHELTDCAAEVLLARAADPAYPRENVARLIEVIVKSRSLRYATVLARVREQTKSMTVDLLAAKAAKKLGRKEDEYVPGSIDIHAIVAPVQAAARAAQPTSAQGEHLSQFKGETFADLFAWAGAPHHVSAKRMTFYDDKLLTIEGNRLEFYYRGVGRVQFDFDRVIRDWSLRQIIADPLAFEQAFGILDGPDLEMTQLVSGYVAAMKNVVQVSVRRPARPLEFMDTAAEILVTEFDSSTDPQTIDMYAWICRLLTQHGGHRYDTVLARVAAGTRDGKLRDFAEMAVVEKTDVPAGTYVPGTISLAAQRAKYPSPFPDSTFTSGHL